MLSMEEKISFITLSNSALIRNVKKILKNAFDVLSVLVCQIVDLDTNPCLYSSPTLIVITINLNLDLLQYEKNTQFVQ